VRFLQVTGLPNVSELMQVMHTCDTAITFAVSQKTYKKKQNVNLPSLLPDSCMLPRTKLLQALHGEPLELFGYKNHHQTTDTMTSKSPSFTMSAFKVSTIKKVKKKENVRATAGMDVDNI